jgi:hypothetical protein
MQVINKLHKFLKAYFTQGYEARAEEAKEDEDKSNVESPEFPEDSPAHSTVNHVSILDFDCDACKRLLYRPVVLNCGHVVCMFHCQSASQSNDGGCECPACHQVSVHRPSLCKQIDDVLIKVFHKESVSREKEVESCQTPVKQVVDHHPSIAERAPSEEVEAWNIPPTLSGTTAAFMRQWLNSEEYAHYGVGCDACGAYPITGRRYKCQDCPEAVGFDLCGVCYDNIRQNKVHGRFNQRHTPEHRMELVRPRLTSLHMLQATNPDLTFNQIMSLLEMSWSDRDEHVEEGEARGREPMDTAMGGEEVQTDLAGAGTGAGEDMSSAGGAGDVHGSEGVSPEEAASNGLNPMPQWRARGPRPHPDPSAEWPSPSAP